MEKINSKSVVCKGAVVPSGARRSIRLAGRMIRAEDGSGDWVAIRRTIIGDDVLVETMRTPVRDEAAAYLFEITTAPAAKAVIVEAELE